MCSSTIIVRLLDMKALREYDKALEMWLRRILLKELDSIEFVKELITYSPILRDYLECSTPQASISIVGYWHWGLFEFIQFVSRK